MHEEKRTFESSSQIYRGLKSQPRLAIGNDGEWVVISGEESGGKPPSKTGFKFSREIILRLIDWMKQP